MDTSVLFPSNQVWGTRMWKSPTDMLIPRKHEWNGSETSIGTHEERENTMVSLSMSNGSARYT